MDRRHERRRSRQWRSYLESIFITWANLAKAKVVSRSKQVNWWVASRDDGPRIWSSLEAGRLISHDVCSRHQRGVRTAQGPTWQGRCEHDSMDRFQACGSNPYQSVGGIGVMGHQCLRHHYPRQEGQSFGNSILCQAASRRVLRISTSSYGTCRWPSCISISPSWTSRCTSS